VGEALFLSHLSNHLKELGLDTQKAHKTALKAHARSVLYAHKLTIIIIIIDALLKNPVALKVLVWSRGRLVTLQILTSSSFCLVKETHGSLGQSFPKLTEGVVSLPM